jgi:outer membrane protein assembly factor BamD
VIKDHQTTTHAPEALHRLVESYMAIGVTNEAQATAAVLGYNYPGTEWYADSYALLTGIDVMPEEQEGSWISRTWNAVF